VSELPVPPLAAADRNARELVRVWAASGRQHVSIATGLWSDPAAWGLLLVDLARHAANAYEQTEGRKASEVLARIKAAFDTTLAVVTGRRSSRATISSRGDCSWPGGRSAAGQRRASRVCVLA
jgi:hypothetical protein